MVVKAIADVTPRGVVYTLRSVLRGLTMSSLAHFTGVIYSPAWVFTLSVYHHRFPKTSNSKRAEVKHSCFLYVVIKSINNNLALECLSELKKTNKSTKRN